MAAKLITKEIATKAMKQFRLGSDMSQLVVAKFFDPYGSGSWFLMNIDPEDGDYCWGIVKGFEVEVGSFSVSELSALRKFGIPRIERDLYFEPRPAKEVYEDLVAGKHV